jgi:hypothetical protein
MDAGSTAQIASAMFTAVTATAALVAIRQAKQQTLTAREALETRQSRCVRHLRVSDTEGRHRRASDG